MDDLFLSYRLNLDPELFCACRGERSRVRSRAFRNTQALGSRMLIVYYAHMKIFLLYMRNVIFIFIIIIVIIIIIIKK